MITIFGIPNCDKCRAARRWFDQHGVDHQFHDLRKDGLTVKLSGDWLGKLGQKALVNKRSTTWREIGSTLPDSPADMEMAKILATHPTLVKRPLIDTGDELLVGYDEGRWQQLIT